MSDKITYSELVDLIAAASGKPKQFVTDFIKDLVDIINAGLERDGKVRLGGFGIFELHNIPETTGTNPRTGEPISIEAHTRVAFKVSDAIGKHVNRSYAHLPTEVIDKPAAQPEQAEPEEADDTAVPAESAAEPAPEAAPASAAKPVERPKPPVPQKRSRIGDLLAAAAVLVAALIIAYSYYGGSIPEVGGKFTGLKESMANRWAEFRAEDSTTVDLPIADADSPDSQYMQPMSDSMEVTTIAKLELGEESGGVIFAEDDRLPSDDELDEGGTSAPMTTHTIPAPTPSITRYRRDSTIQHRVGPGDHLWNLAEEHYHEPLFWVHIYGANKARIDNPDSLPPGEIITIPAFDGSPSALSIRDSVNLSMGALQAYEAYKNRNLEWSAYYLRMSRRYQPAAVTAGAR